MASEQARRRQVNTTLAIGDRRCLYCLSPDGAFHSEEHVIPRSLGPTVADLVIPPGVVCDGCNSFLGRQVDAPFVDRFDMKLTRGLEGRRGRVGRPPLVIEGRDVTAKLDVEIDGAAVTLYAARVTEIGDGGLDIEIRPLARDPSDIVARTIRALWKIALGSAWLRYGKEALDHRWDHLRHAVLGAPFRGFLLQAPFTATVTRQLRVEISLDKPSDPFAATFVMGGVALAAPLASGARVTRAEAERIGWRVHTTEGSAPSAVHLRLTPSDPT